VTGAVHGGLVGSASTFISTLASFNVRHRLGGICMMSYGVLALAM